MSTDAEKLAEIDALCDADGADIEGGDGFLMTSQVRAILAEPGPAVEGVTLTPEEARRAVGWLDMSNLVPEGDDLELVNRLEAAS